MEYLIPLAIFAALGILAGVLLTVASKVFAVEVDERVDAIAEALPQANCGACGFSGCADYADAIVNKGAECNLCRPGGEAAAKKIAEIMGVEVTAAEPQVAFVRCSGDCSHTPHKYDFDGIQSCAACNRFYDGSKLCTSGCLGYGDCIKVCSQGAISIVDGISQAVDICCSSRDVGRVTRSVCPNGCIGCKLCEKNCPSGAVTVQNNHAVIDYDKCTNCGKCADVCRVHAIRSIMGEKVEVQ